MGDGGADNGPVSETSDKIWDAVIVSRGSTCRSIKSSYSDDSGWYTTIGLPPALADMGSGR